MILIKELITNLEIKSVKDLYKLKPLMEVTSLNINKSEIARELNVDRRTNARFAQFAKDYGFTVRPCIAGRPQTKAKVEAPMKLLDEIRSYNGKLDYDGLTKLVQKLNDRKNAEVVQGTGIVPVMFLKKEKAFLNSLPPESIRKPYRIKPKILKVNHSSMINHSNCQYFLPPEFIDKYLTVQIYGSNLHVYDSTKLIALHEVSQKRLNYLSENYMEIARF